MFKHLSPAMKLVAWANLSLLVLFPVAWAAPLMRAGLLPLFRLSEVSILSGIVALWQADLLLALIVILFAMIAPIAKIVGLSCIHLQITGNRTLGLITFMGRLAMADIFLVALYVVIAKGTGVGRLETAWGLYLFTACVLVSLALGQVTKRQNVVAI
jgi:uncharacterized paraquat-inducible protein A